MYACEIPMRGIRVYLTPETEARIVASLMPHWAIPAGTTWFILREEGCLQRLRAIPINPHSGEPLWPNHWLGIAEDMEVIPINP